MSSDYTPSDCTCDTEDHEAHSCPFREEVHNDNETECECCPACTRECRYDV